MNGLMLIPAGLLALSACAQTPAPALDIVTAAPPTNMTSSQGYQRFNGVQSGLMGAAPDNMTGS